MTDITHAEVREVLPSFVRDGSDSLSIRRHLARCEECRTELARYESLLGALSSMASVTSEPPPALVTALNEIPAHAGTVEQVRTHLTRHRTRYLGGAAVVVAGAAGAALLRSRQRRFATAAS